MGEIEATLQLDSGAETQTPQQAFLCFFAEGSSNPCYTFQRKSDSLSLFVDISKQGELDFSNQNATYNLRVFVSDPQLSKKYNWEAGEVQLSFVPTPAFIAKQANSELQQWNRRPEFTHQMRPEARRAPAFMAYIFTLALGAPVLILLIMLGRIGVSFSLPSFTGAVQGLIFHVAVTVMLLIICAYWLFLTIFPTLFLLTVVGLVAYFFRPSSGAKEHQD